MVFGPGSKDHKFHPSGRIIEQLRVYIDLGVSSWKTPDTMSLIHI